MGSYRPGPKRTGAASTGRARSVSEGHRRTKLAEDLAAPLPLGAAVDDYTEWPEGRLQTEILSLCTELDGRLQRQHRGVPGMRLKAHHETDSRLSRPGLPDLLIAGPGGQIWAELKRQAKRAKASVEQQVWLDTLLAGGAAAFLWRPEDWMSGAIQNELYRIARPIRRPARVPATPPPARPRACGCPATVRPSEHTCEVWGPPTPYTER